jgi:hypothetical protein
MVRDRDASVAAPGQIFMIHHVRCMKAGRTVD